MNSREDIHHPDAARIRSEADAFRADLRAAILHATEQAPVTQLRDGTYAPYVPTEPNQRFRRFGPLGTAYYTRFGPMSEPMMRLASIREVLYGPIILLNVGLFDVHEPLADWVLNDWEDNVTLTSGLGLNVHGLTDDRPWFSQGGMVFQCNLQNPVLVYLTRGELPKRNPAQIVWLVARTPKGPIREVTINGKSWTDIDGPQEAIRLPRSDSRLDIQIRY